MKGKECKHQTLCRRAAETPWFHLSGTVGYTPSTAGNSMTGSERPSPEPLLKKEASPAVLGGREFWKCSGRLRCLELWGLGDPSRTLEGNSRKPSESVCGVFPEFFQNFFRKVPAVLGVWPTQNSAMCDTRAAILPKAAVKPMLVPFVVVNEPRVPI